MESTWETPPVSLPQDSPRRCGVRVPGLQWEATGSTPWCLLVSLGGDMVFCPPDLSFSTPFSMWQTNPSTPAPAPAEVHETCGALPPPRSDMVRGGSQAAWGQSTALVCASRTPLPQVPLQNEDGGKVPQDQMT